MSWLAVRDLSDPGSIPFGSALKQPTDPDALLARGHFLAEVDALDQPIGTRTLLSSNAAGSGQFGLLLEAGAEGSVTLACTQGNETIRLRTAPDAAMLSGRLLVSYIWDGPARNGQLVVTALGSGKTATASTNAPFPIPLRLIQSLAAAPDRCGADPSLMYFGFSDDATHPDLRVSLSASCPVQTTAGPQLIRGIDIDDLILTRDNGPLPVRQILKCEVPALGWFRPLRLRAPYFGLAQDVLVAPHQKILLDGDMIEYLFGEEEVLASTGELADGASVHPEPRLKTIRYFHLLFDTHCLIDVGGAAMTSLFNPAARPATDSGAAGMPLHHGIVRPDLRPYEALTLRSLRVSQV